jgi:hypothetical protein
MSVIDTSLVFCSSNQVATLCEIGCREDLVSAYASDFLKLLSSSLHTWFTSWQNIPSIESLFSVRVPVLSNTIACTFASFSIFSADFEGGK